MFGQLLRPALHSFNIRTLNGILQRKFSSSAPFQHSFLLEQLERRYLIKLSGPDTTKFLQGMITNDIRHLEADPETSVTLPSMYAMLLNMQGRVLYDTLVYKLKQKKDEYLIEYDSSALQYMQTHLKMYRVRKEVAVETVHENMVVWSVYPNPNEITLESVKDFPASYIDELNCKDSVITAIRDPRLPQLGYRVILHRDVDLKALLPDCSISSPNDNQYMLLRYKLGVGEGVKDLPPGNCFALESNVDYLHGVSFHKGCYIGQELTARIYHTGVIRKRLMPVILNIESSQLPDIPTDCIVLNEHGLKMGKFRNHIKKYGLALLKVEDSLKAQTLSLKDLDITMKPFKPKWWPQEMGMKEPLGNKL